MKFEILDQGFVYKCGPGGDESSAATSRCAVTRTGDILCSFMLQSDLGVNGFVPCLSRSNDSGASWQYEGPLWPHVREKYSMNPSISRSHDGELFLFGSKTPITEPGEPFWCQETLGILQNELIWSRSLDDGRTWTEPQAVPVPLPGAAETPAPLCVTRSGRWLGPYAPHNTFDPDLEVDRGHTVIVVSDDQGKTWGHVSALRFSEPDAVCAESWVIELSDGRLLATTAKLRLGAGDDYPNAYALSSDNGQTWAPTRSTGLPGQASAPAALPDGRVLYTYAQRQQEPRGVWLALAKPTDSDYGVKATQLVWHPETPTQSDSSGKFEEWTDFAFGEPQVTLLPDDTALVVCWCAQPSGRGIRFVKVKIN